jgi:hypothetical protein
VRVMGRARGVPIGLALALCVLRHASSATAGELAPTVAGSLQPMITTSELVVGPNRFAFGLLKDGNLLAAGDVALRVYDIREQEAQLVAVTPAVYHPLELISQGRQIHVHPDGTQHAHDTATDVHGIYVAQLTLERPGPWGLEIVVRRANGAVEAARLSVNALPQARSPMPGTPAPRSRNLVAADVSDLRQIDSSEPPDARLHQTVIADAIRDGRPQVIVFATPKYCTSRVCGPVLDVVRTLIPAYGRRVAFVHQEIWQPGGMQTLTPTVEEWNLRSEPWTFVVDGDGIIRARFEGLTTRRELEAILRQMLR